MSHQEQVPTIDFFDKTKQVLTKYTNLLGIIDSEGVPQWVKEVGSALNGNSPDNIISGRNKVVVIKI